MAPNVLPTFDRCYKSFRECIFTQGNNTALLAWILICASNLQSLHLHAQDTTGGTTVLQLTLSKREIDRNLDIVPFKSLKTVSVKTEIDVIIPILRNVVHLNVTSDCGDLAFATEDFQPGESTSLRTLTVIGPHRLFAAVSALAREGRLKKLNKAWLGGLTWRDGEPMKKLASSLARFCPKLQVLSLDRGYQSAEDDGDIAPLTASIISAIDPQLGLLRLYADCLVTRLGNASQDGRDAGQLLASLLTTVPPSVVTVEITGVLEDEFRSVLSDLEVLHP